PQSPLFPYTTLFRSSHSAFGLSSKRRRLRPSTPGAFRPHRSASVGYRSSSSTVREQALPLPLPVGTYMTSGTRADSSNRHIFCQDRKSTRLNSSHDQ